jgi:hypothetical protein
MNCLRCGNPDVLLDDEFGEWSCRSCGHRRPALEIGTRVRLKHNVDRFPHFLAPAGSVGTVLELDEVGGVWIEMEQRIPGCKEWNNAIVWESPNEALQDVEVLS